MCGIVGIIGSEPAAPILLDALKRLEYRGYDSAGVTTVLPDGALTRLRRAGKLRNLESALRAEPLEGTSGIAHTRWATHGPPTEANAHPHEVNGVAVVHNGIIENFRPLRDRLVADGVSLSSQTDTEVVAGLLSHRLQQGEPLRKALIATIDELHGAYALAFAFADAPDRLAAARFGSPLAIGFGEGLVMIGSDAIALAPYCDEILYLEDGDAALLAPGSVEVFGADGRSVERPVQPIPMQISLAEKGNYRHFMAKEIHEQPDVIGRTLGHYLDVGAGVVREGAAPVDFSKFRRISLTACGTAFYAGLVVRYAFERYAGLPVDLDVASEFRYRAQALPADDLAMFVSQSGETADTLACLRRCKEAGQTLFAIVNVPTSTMAREADLVLPTLAGPEIGVASTKAFTCQLAALSVLAIKAGLDRGVLSAEEAAEHFAVLAEVPRLVAAALRLETQVERMAHHIAPASTALYVGRGASFAIAMEGALKLKELSYIHAEGYAAGELKHGPIALIDDSVPVIVVAPHDDLFAKTLSNVEEVAARGGKVIAVTDAQGAEELGRITDQILVVPDAPPLTMAIVNAVPMQLLAYHTAILNGTDVDQPRNLAKSVTVE